MRASGSRANGTGNAERGMRNSRSVVDSRSSLRGSTRARSVPHSAFRVPRFSVPRSAFRVPRFHNRPLPCLRTPVSARTASAGSPLRATDVPTSTRSAPAAAIRSTSARVSMPLSATAGTPAGTRASRHTSSRLPPKCRPSVSTEMAVAPPCSYARACATGSRSSRIGPAEGERRLTSAITPIAGAASTGAKRRGSGACAARCASSRALGRRLAMRSRVALRMASRRLSGMLAFGRFSGRLGFGFRSGEIVPLTRRQREILDFISGQITAHGYAPSFEEIAQRFTFRSLATVHEHLTNLERKGYIRRAHNESRGIEVVPPRGQTGASELPLYGLVAAGEPIEAVSGSDTIAVPDELVPRRGRSYVLKVRGQSMIDEHIKDGDFIVVHERNQADNGQTVVALVQGSSATVKRFYREPGGWIRLEPANPAMTPLRLNERDVTVQGVVVGVIRRY